MRRRANSSLAAALLLTLLAACSSQPEASRDDDSASSSPVLGEESGAVEAPSCREADGNTRPAEDLSPGDTGAFVGEVASVQYARSSTGSPVFINVGADYPDSELSVAIFSNSVPSLAKWARARVRAGDIVCASGTVQDFNGVAQVVLTSPSDLQVESEGPATRAAYLAKPCAQVYLNFKTWSAPPTGQQMQRAALNPDYPRSNDFEPGEVGYDIVEALMRYQEETEELSYILYDPNLPEFAAYDLTDQILDTLRNVVRACGGLASLGGQPPNFALR